MNAYGFGGLAVFVGVWLVSLGLVARLGGWRELARHYRAQRDYRGPKWYFQHARLRYGVAYNGCVTVGADRFGVHLALLLPFRFAHPSLFVPWSELRAVTERRWFGNLVRLSCVRVPNVPIVVHERLVERVRAASTRAMVDQRVLEAVGL